MNLYSTNNFSVDLRCGGDNIIETWAAHTHTLRAIRNSISKYSSGGTMEGKKVRHGHDKKGHGRPDDGKNIFHSNIPFPLSLCRNWNSLNIIDWSTRNGATQKMDSSSHSIPYGGVGGISGEKSHFVDYTNHHIMVAQHIVKQFILSKLNI